ncbi:MAG: glutathione S-transferase [Alphaproteobacteria bacterium]|nr:glutathione S-transferase [Alphaproteobacteria bacterium]|tara:strand:+ start:1959 stop:2672 length:714 start_codon:yes stop_codon:yes gene_type:complete
MIELYTWPTPNGVKVHIMLEETGLEYNVHPINIQKGDQFDPEFLKFSPNNRMPAMIDTDGPGGEPISLFESGAMLIYLGEKTGMFYPTDDRLRYETICWVMFQMGGVGPMLGQNNHFRMYAKDMGHEVQYAVDRYSNETRRLYGVVDERLADNDWLAAGQYTIADMATFPWLRLNERFDIELDEFPNIKRWHDAIDARPAVAKGKEILVEYREKANAELDPKEMQSNMFGAAQFAQR